MDYSENGSEEYEHRTLKQTATVSKKRRLDPYLWNLMFRK
jgi:hypothetical protein